MTEADIIRALPELVASAVHNADAFNKVWGVVVPLLSVLVGSVISLLGQYWLDHRKRVAEDKNSERASNEEDKRLEGQLEMQDIASQRKAHAKVAQMRQVWINDLRGDMATYLAMWQDVSWRWQAIVEKPRTELAPDMELESFTMPIIELRRKAHELQLKIVLRLNMAEKPHRELREMMTLLEGTTSLYKRDLSSLPPQLVQDKFCNTVQLITAKVQDILKREWIVVKGELGVHAAGAQTGGKKSQPA